MDLKRNSHADLLFVEPYISESFLFIGSIVTHLSEALSYSY